MNKFRKWVYSYGPVKLSRVLGVARSGVYMWAYGERFPHVRVAFRLIELSNGELTLADIYEAKKCKSNMRRSAGK